MSQKPSSLRSKKFFAYLISDLGWKFLTFYVLWQYKSDINHYGFMVLTAMIVTSGFLQIGYILGQVALDKYVHVATEAMARQNDSEDASKSEKG
jgi:hypothetical protein